MDEQTAHLIELGGYGEDERFAIVKFEYRTVLSRAKLEELISEAYAEERELGKPGPLWESTVVMVARQRKMLLFNGQGAPASQLGPRMLERLIRGWTAFFESNGKSMTLKQYADEDAE